MAKEGKEDKSANATDVDTLTDGKTGGEMDGQSAIFVGRWRGLVSTTNWEKGQVIAEWRAALVESGADASEYSDEAWSRRVGGVSPQHVGRLRRVHESYGESRTEFEGLYWSHFHATIDWDDAEMWLEGAVQNNWSVSNMRRQRWETLGSVEADKPDDGDIVLTDKDEDIDFDETQPLKDTVDARLETVEGYAKEEHPDADENGDDDGDTLAADNTEPKESLPPVRPFADLPELPDDLADAFDDMKLAILRHKVNEWEEVSLNDLLMSLDALKQLAAAPSDVSTAS